MEMETQPAAQPASRMTDQIQLCTKIKALIAKGDKAAEKSEQFHIAAGLELKRLKDGCVTQTYFLALIEKRIGLRKSRAYELLQIADGKKTVAEVRADTAKRTADSKARLKASASSGQPEPSDDDKQDDRQRLLAAKWQNAAANKESRRVLADQLHRVEAIKAFFYVADLALRIEDVDISAVQPSTKILETALSVVKAWSAAIDRLGARIEAAPEAPVEPAPAPAPVDRSDPGDIPEELRRTPAPADDDYQPPEFVKAAFARGGAA
jgi:hypothetical protein